MQVFSPAVGQVTLSKSLSCWGLSLLICKTGALDHSTTQSLPREPVVCRGPRLPPYGVTIASVCCPRSLVYQVCSEVS